MENHHSGFLIIPAFIADDPEIDDSTAILFGRLVALSNQKGYCWASNEYLSNLTRVKDRELQNRLKVLEDKGYLKRVITKNGFNWDRKLYPIMNSKIVYEAHDCAPSKRTPVHVEAHTCAPDIDKCSNNIKEQQQPAQAAAVFSCLKDENRLTKSDINWLMKFTEAEVEEALKYTQEEADQGKIKTTFSQTIKWAIKEKPKRTQKIDTVVNRMISQALEDQWFSPYYRLDSCTDSAMIIALGAQMDPKVISYEEPDFFNKLKSMLVKMGFTARESG